MYASYHEKIVIISNFWVDRRCRPAGWIARVDIVDQIKSQIQGFTYIAYSIYGILKTYHFKFHQEDLLFDVVIVLLYTLSTPTTHFQMLKEFGHQTADR